MIRIKVEYDRYTRTFKLLDREFGSILEDGAEYDLLVQLTVDTHEQEGNVLYLDSAALAHA